MKRKFYKTISMLVAIIVALACCNSPCHALRPTSMADRPSPFTFEETNEKLNGAMRLTKVRFVRAGRIAEGYVIVMRPEQLETGIWVDRGMVDYDFSKYAMTDAVVASKKAVGEDVTQKDLPGKTVPQFFADALSEMDGVNMATAATQGGFWGDNTFVIINGKLIKKEVPGLYPPSYPARHSPVTGDFFFFVFDAWKVGIRKIHIENGEASDDISDIGCAFCGPPMLLDGINVSGNITYIKDAAGKQVPLRGPYQVNWNPETLISQFSAWGRGLNGEIVYMGFVGNPEKPQEQPGVYCAELVELARELGITELILGPGSVDVNVCVSGQGHILESLPGPESATAKAFPGGRPLGTIFWAKAKRGEQPDAKETGEPPSDELDFIQSLKTTGLLGKLAQAI